MYHYLRMFALALAVAASPFSQAAVVNFDDPGVIEIDNDNDRAVYQEAGFLLTGSAAGFLPIDGIGSGGSGGLVIFAGNTLSVRASDGSAFNFSALDAGSFDASGSADLGITGLFADNTRSNLMLTLGSLGTLPLSAWNGLSELRLTASADLVIDNLAVSPVPEPGTVAMLVLGLAGLGALRHRSVMRARR